MWTAPFVEHTLETHADDRGSLAELLKFTKWGIPAGGRLYTFTIEPGQTRGNHYHTIQHEWFMCLKGMVLVFLEHSTIDTVVLEPTSKIL